MAKDPRNISYKRLQTKVLNNRKRAYDFDDTLSRVMQSLWPKQSGPKKDNQESALQDLQNNFNKRLALMDKDNARQLNNVRRAGEETAAAIKSSADKERQKSMGITKSLGEAVQRLYEARKQGSQSASIPQTAESAATPIQDNSLSYITPQVKPLPKNDYVVPDDIITESAPIDDVVKKAVLNIDQEVAFGDNYYRITNLFGPRTGENAVSGKGPEHSRGVDVVAHDSTRAKTNAPISVTDGVIISVSLQGSGKTTGTDKTKGGYIMNVQMPNGKIIRYMHLSPDIEAVRGGLIGKKVKRGDILFEGDHSKWSGSGSANHTKISISSVDEKGNFLNDHDNPENDPTPYILYGNTAN